MRRRPVVDLFICESSVGDDEGGGVVVDAEDDGGTC